MNKNNTLKRDWEIFKMSYFYGETLEDISNKYNLKISTVKKILNKERKTFNERSDFLDNLRDYLYKNNFTKHTTSTIINSLSRHTYRVVSANLSKDNLIESIKSDKHIRGIGKGSRDILREFIKTYEKIQ